jgi:hypothetical protein
MRTRKHVHLWPTYLWIAGASLIVVVPVLALLGLSYVNGFVDGQKRGVAEGQRLVSTGACERLAHQFNWTNNVERDRVASKQTTQSQANDVLMAEAAAYAYSCGGPIPVDDLYYPSTKDVPVTTNTTPTVKIAAKRPRLKCSLSATSCPQEGIN